MLEYMTSELYIEGQKEDSTDDKWEENLIAYRKRLDEITPSFPQSVAKFLELMCLYDADLVANNLATHTFENGHFPAGTIMRLAVEQRNWGEDMYACNLTYVLSSELKSKRYFDTPGCKDKDRVWSYNEVWLYDEFDINKRGRVIHSILFSSGLELEIPIKEFHWFKAPILPTHDF